MKLLKPCLDIVFKMLFERDPESLREMLEVVLGESIESVELVQPGVYGDWTQSKYIELDVRVVVRDGRRVDVEMQMQLQPELPARMVFYGAREYVGQLRVGQPYGELAPSIVIVWLGQRLFPYNPQLLHRVFELRERTSGEVFSEHLAVHVLQLPDFRTASGRPESAAEQKLRRWAEFFLVETPQQLAALEEKEPSMSRIVENLEKLSMDPEVARQVLEREQAARLYESSIRAAAKQAKAEGRQEGRQEGQSGMLTKQLHLKFGELSNETRQKIQSASSDDLDRWTKQVLTANTLEEALR